MRSQNAARLACVGYRFATGAILTVTRPSGTKPLGTRCRWTKLRTVRPAATSSTIDSAISAVTRPPRIRLWRPPTVARADAFRSSLMLLPLNCRAGARPNIKPDTADTARPNSSTWRSTETSPATVRSDGLSATSPDTSHMATSTPAPPPSAAKRRLSVSSCATMRPRVAPRATRSDTSCWRAVARASRRPETLAVAISSKRATAAKSRSVVD